MFLVYVFAGEGTEVTPSIDISDEPIVRAAWSCELLSLSPESVQYSNKIGDCQ